MEFVEYKCTQCAAPVEIEASIKVDFPVFCIHCIQELSDDSEEDDTRIVQE